MPAGSRCVCWLWSDLIFSAAYFQPCIGQPEVKQDLRVSIWLWMKEDREMAAVSFQGKYQGDKVMAKGRKAQQLRVEEGRKSFCCREAMEGWQGQREGAAWKVRRDEKRWEARYLLPCLSESKRCQKFEKRAERREERQRRKVGEETRASYCD